MMKMRVIKIDGGIDPRETDSQKWLSHFGELVDGSLWVNERRTFGHEGDLGHLCTIEVRVQSRKFEVPIVSTSVWSQWAG